MTEDIALRLKLDVLLKEADIFQSEMDKRLDRQAQSFYFCTVILAGVITGVATLADNNSLKSIDLLIYILVLLPFLTTPLAAMFFDDELLLGVTDYHFHYHVVPETRTVLEKAGFSGGDLFQCTLKSRFASVKADLRTHHGVKIWTPRFAANIRSTIFLLPFLFASVAIALLFGNFLLVPISPITKLVSIAGGVVDAALLIITLLMWLSTFKVWRQIIKVAPREKSN